MSIHMDYLALKAKIASELESAGFTVVDKLSMEMTTAVAAKDYTTIAGIRTGIVYLTGGAHDGAYRLDGFYETDDRNALTATNTIISVGDTSDEVKDATKSFAAVMEEAINGTYGRRMYFAAITGGTRVA